MNFTEIDAGHSAAFELQVTPIGNSAFAAPREGEEIELFRVGDEGAYVRRPHGDHHVAVEATHPGARRDLAALLDAGRPLLCWVARMRPTKDDRLVRILVEVRIMAQRIIAPAALPIHVDRLLVGQISRNERRDLSLTEAVQWLSDQFLLPRSGPERTVRAVMVPGRTEESTFLLRGREWSLRVRRRDGGWLGDSLIRPRRDLNSAVALLEANILFGDHPSASDIASGTNLDDLVRRAGSYLHLWREYQRLEWSTIAREAQAFGHLRYESIHRRADGDWEFSIRQEPSEAQRFILTKGDETIVGASVLPDYLLTPTIPAFGQEDLGGTRGFSGTCERISGTTLILSPDSASSDRLPDRKGYLFLDLRGDMANIKRRVEARTRIESGRTGVPLLGWLEGSPINARQGRRYPALSAAAKRHFGAAGPNPRQIEALDVALNSPDIALIQGPPGTGKTRTIAALLTRLTEIAEKEERGLDKNLLTSFQHDAVENAAAISGVNGLPAIKIGKKRGVEGSTLALEKWRRERILELEASLVHLGTRPKRLILRELRLQHISYLGSPSNFEGGADTLAEALSKARHLLPDSLQDEIRAQIQKLRRSDEGVDSDLLELVNDVRGLRVGEESFKDDGPRAAFRLARRLEQAGRLDTEVGGALERAKNWREGDPLDFLPELLSVRDGLLDEFAAPRPKAKTPLVNIDVATLLEKIVQAVEARISESPDEGLDLVVENLLHDLKHANQELAETLTRYTVVLAATCQQSASKVMLDHLESDDDFASVIVDEAARANPLDLMIPISRARRRIVLVGDHRQLPHMLEPSIERELDQSMDEATREAMKRSLFQRLFDYAKTQERSDGIKRWVTLNAQYRMHPVLGRFVSRVFYERHDAAEKFDSPGDSAYYAHPLQRAWKGKQAGWKQIPLHVGREERVGTSWRRPAEARWIAGEVHQILETHRNLSVGVITFYRGQVDCILQEMHEVGLAEPDEQTGDLRVARSWETTETVSGEPTERLRVGTVDAFQGKEFDVVILSMTRANDLVGATPAVKRRKFGHLLLENRLCVAMSRQRQLLIVVGDSAMIGGETNESVYGLSEYFALCQSAEGVVVP